MPSHFLVSVVTSSIITGESKSICIFGQQKFSTYLQFIKSKKANPKKPEQCNNSRLVRNTAFLIVLCMQLCHQTGQVLNFAIKLVMMVIAMMGAWWMPNYARTIRRCLYMSSYGIFAVYQLAFSPDLQAELVDVCNQVYIWLNKPLRFFNFIGLTTHATRRQIVFVVTSVTTVAGFTGIVCHSVFFHF